MFLKQGSGSEHGRNTGNRQGTSQSTAGIPGTGRAPVRARLEYREQAGYRVRARPEYREQAGYQSEHSRNTGNRQGTGS
ncbi:hypothetical protein chiPu_0033257, partial [Chiloscyllium punctatum]|nr:hypothetical protein [Chiloscyllium punctatum]